jgi:hypothetical protein
MLSIFKPEEVLIKETMCEGKNVEAMMYSILKD